MFLFNLNKFIVISTDIKTFEKFPFLKYFRKFKKKAETQFTKFLLCL